MKKVIILGLLFLLVISCATTLSRDWSLVPIGEQDNIKKGIFYFPYKDVFEATLETLLEEEYDIIDIDKESGFFKALDTSWRKLHLNCYIREKQKSVKVDFQIFGEGFIISKKQTPEYFEMWYRTIWLRLTGRYEINE